MRDLAAERTDVNEKIAAELQRIVRQLENGAAVVRSRQRTLRADLAQAKQRSTVDRQAEVRLRELEREAAAIREQYQAFLERFKQTTDQAAVVSADARIISQAPVPKGRARWGSSSSRSSASPPAPSWAAWAWCCASGSTRACARWTRSSAT